MKKLVNLLMASCFLILVSTSFSSDFNYLDKSDKEISCNAEPVSTVEGVDPCGGISGTSFYIADEVVAAGDPVYVAVTASQFNVATFAWSMAYDSTVIRLDSVKNRSPLTNRRTIPNFGDGSLDPFENYNTVGFNPLPSTLPPPGDYPPGTNKLITVVWATPNAQPLMKSDCDSIFFMCFTAIGDPGDEAKIEFFDQPTGVDVTDGVNTLLNDLSGFAGGSVTISGGTTGNVDPLELTLSGSTIEEGETKCFPVSVDGFEDIFSFSSDITWNSNTLQYSSVQGFNLTGLDAGDFTATSGKLVLNWQSNGSTPTTVNNGTNIFEVCFEAAGSAGASTLVAIGETPGTSIGSSSGNTSFNSSSTTITVESPPGNCGSISGLSFYAEDKKVLPNNPVYVAVTASQFNVATLAWSMAYDSTVIRLDSVKNRSPFTNARTIPNFGDGSLDPFENYNTVGFNPLPSTLPPASDYPAGTNKLITMVWATPNAQPLMKNDCDTIFFMCFTAIGDLGDKSPIEFFDKPTGVDVTDGASTLLNNLSGFDGGSVELADDKASLRLNLAGGSLEKDATKCFQVSTNGLEDVFSFGSEITWDQSILKYDRVGAFNLTDLDSGDFDVSNTGSGKLTLNWQRSGSTPTTVANGTNIFEVCFEAVGAAGASSTVSFAEAPGTSVGSTTGAIFSGSSSTISIDSPPGNCGTISGLSFYAEDKKAKENEPVYIAVTASQFNVATLAWSMAYDSTVIRLDSVKNRSPFTNTRTIPNFGDGSLDPFENYNTVGFNPLPSTLPPASDYPAGTNKLITMVWATPNAQPLMKNDCDTIFFMCFTTVGDIGDRSPIEFFDKPTGIDITDGTNTLLDNLSGFDGGSVEIVDDSQASLRLNLAGGSLEEAERKCFNVSTNGLEDVFSFGTEISWNQNVLRYDRTGAYNLSDLDAGDFDTSNTANGKLTLNWQRNGSTPTTVANGTNIFELCFEAVGAGGASSNVSLTEAPGTSVGSTTGATFTNSNSTISINTPPGACGSINGLSFYAGHEKAKRNQPVYVPVTVNEFDVATFAWSMAYDESIIRLDSVKNRSPYTNARTIPNFGDGSLDPFENYNTIGFDPLPSTLPPSSDYPAGTNKLITVVYATPGATTISLNNCDTLFWMCFTTVGNIGEVSPVVFFDKPTGVDITDGNNTLLNDLSGFEGGSVEILDDVLSPSAPSNVNITNVACKTESTGAIEITYPNGNYTFEWTGGRTGKIISGLPAGSYTLTITDRGTLLTYQNTYTVTEPSTSLSVTGSITNEIDCGGDNDGAINAMANGGTAGYTYNWTGNRTGATISNLAGGTYNVTVTDVNGCISTAGPFTLAEPDALTIPNPSVTEISCAGNNNGAISITPAGGARPYEFNWTGPDVSPTSRTQSGLSAGSFDVTVTDSNGCQEFESFTLNEPAPIVAGTPNITHSTNGSNGAISINPSGGSLNGLPDYIYAWTAPGFFSTDRNISGLAPGVYTLMITDGKNCRESFTYTVENRTPKARIVDVILINSCPGESTGSITVFFADGVSPSVSIKNLAGVTVGSNIASGQPGGTNYLIELSDQGVICDQRTVFLQEYSQMVVTGTATDDTDNGNGTITVNVTNTIGALSYDWVPSLPDNRTVTGLSAGTYCVTVNDGTTGCSASECFDIEDKRPIVIDEPATAILHVACPGGNDGSFSLQFSQGVPPFDISVTGANSFTDRTSSFTYTKPGLRAGTYNVVVTDANGNVDNTTVIIDQPNAFSASAKITPRTDAGNGSIDLTVTGGTQPYTFRWSDGQANEDPVNLLDGNAICTVTDANGCEFITPTFVVSYFRVLSDNSTDSDCAASANGTASVTVTGGNPPYSYSWTNNGMAVGGNDAQVSGLAPGTAIVTITGNLGTSITKTFTIGTQSTISATATVVRNASCFGLNDGSANVTPSNGQAPYSYLWDTGDDNRDMQQVNGLGAGPATVIVTDAIGCQTTATITISQPEQIAVSANVVDNLCFGENNGEIMLSISGGQPNVSIPRYVVFWDNANLEGQRIRSLASGEYIAMIEDANGCEEEVSITVGGPAEELNFSVETTDDLDGNCTGSIRAEVTGGTGPYFYQWSVEADSTESELTDLCSGAYSLTVTDGNGCMASPSVRMGTILNRGIPCLSTRAVMTPDGEGRNEEFIIYCIEDYPNNTLEIYNRWGQLVWEQDNYDNTWRGTTQRGNDVPDGAYFYVFRYNQGGSIQQQKGSFTLLRQ